MHIPVCLVHLESLGAWKSRPGQALLKHFKSLLCALKGFVPVLTFAPELSMPSSD